MDCFHARIFRQVRYGLETATDPVESFIAKMRQGECPIVEIVGDLLWGRGDNIEPFFSGFNKSQAVMGVRNPQRLAWREQPDFLFPRLPSSSSLVSDVLAIPPHGSFLVPFSSGKEVKSCGILAGKIQLGRIDSDEKTVHTIPFVQISEKGYSRNQFASHNVKKSLGNHKKVRSSSTSAHLKAKVKQVKKITLSRLWRDRVEWRNYFTYTMPFGLDAVPTPLWYPHTPTSVSVISNVPFAPTVRS